MCFLLIEGSRFGDDESECFVGSVKELVKIVKYFPNAVNLAADWAMFFKIHCLHFWTLNGEHCMTVAFSKEWNTAISSRDTDMGSGRSRLAEKEAFAMAS
jgi:hypothetical protein